MRFHRRLLRASAASLIALSGSAYAFARGEVRPLVAPAPDWVLPASIPAAPKAAKGASTVDLLSDVQERFNSDGENAYYRAAYAITSPEGLGDAALQVSWDPALETLTLHSYRIIRDSKTIDLLGDGSKLTVIQRETNMESAALDGRLTATMQPADVRVGDIVEMSFTRLRSDPALGGRSEALVGPSDGRPYGRVRVRFVWPDNKTVRWRAYPGVLKPMLSHSGGNSELVADASDVTTLGAPRGAPSRFNVVNAVEVSEFPDWATVASTELPLYAKAATLEANSPLKAEARKIAAATADPVRRTEMALQLVQEQIRYLFIGMNDGGYVPAAADLTWTRRFGDCKAKTVLLIGLLKELGIDAEPVLVNTENGDFVANRLPAVSAFDHVLVRARINGRTYWLDGTRLGDKRLERLQTPPYHVGLPIAAGSQALVALVPEDLKQPSETLNLALDASAGIDAPAKATGEMRFRDSSAADMRMKYAGLSASDLDQELRDLWRKNYDFVTPSSVKSSVDEATGDFVVAMTGTAKMDWYSDVGTRWYEVDRARLGWKFDISRDGATNKDAPFAIAFPDYWESRETIKLPSGQTGFTLQGGSLDQTVAGIYAFHRKVAIVDGLLTMESSTRALASELPSSKAEQARRELAALANGGVFVRVPETYLATSADIAALQDDKDGLAKALFQRGAVQFDRAQYAESVADETASLAIDPSNATAHAILALAMAVQNDVKADAVADRALAIDDKQTLAWRAKGAVAMLQKRYADADADFSKQLAIDPEDATAHAARASTRLILGKFADALADADAALAASLKTNVRIIRAAALAGLERKEESLAEADRAVAAEPDSEAVRKGRATLRGAFDERALAIEDYDALLKQAPKAEYYIARARMWTAADAAKRNADVNAALRLDPRSTDALALRASLAIEAGDFGAAQKDIALIEKSDSDDRAPYELRHALLEKQGRGRETLQLVDAFVAKHPKDAIALNDRCWTKATFNLEIETALADCDESLKLAPNNAATLDSRAFAKLKLGATDGALADYNAALKLVPSLAASLYGRAIARARTGDEAGARADIAEARKISPEIDGRFANFGISLPASLAAAAQPAARP